MAQLSREDREEGKEWHRARRTEPEWALHARAGKQWRTSDTEKYTQRRTFVMGTSEPNTEGSAEGSDVAISREEGGRGEGLKMTTCLNPSPKPASFS